MTTVQQLTNNIIKINSKQVRIIATDVHTKRIADIVEFNCKDFIVDNQLDIQIVERLLPYFNSVSYNIAVEKRLPNTLYTD